MKYILVLLLAFSLSVSALAQNVEASASVNYAYVMVSGKAFSKKLKVSVDFGDTPEQQSISDAYTEELTNKTSYAAILNYMDAKGFELVQTLETTASIQGYGGTDHLIFIMKKKKAASGL